jgi:outer membrane protein TolC
MTCVRHCALGLASLSVLVAGCAEVDSRYGSVPAQRMAMTHAARETTPAGTAVSSLPENPALTDYLAFAEAGNPGLASARLRWQAAAERVIQAGSLDDPRISYRIAIGRGMRTHEVVVEQMFPLFGKLDLRAAVAREEAEAARQQYEAERLKVAYRVKNVYFEYYYLARSIEAVRQNRDLVKYLGDVALARYRTASGTQPDIIRAQVELGKLDDQLRTLEDSRGAVAARLNAVLARPTESPVPWPAAIVEETFDVPDEQVLAWISRSSPELQAMEHDIARDREAVELAKKDFYPDVGLGLGYMNQVEVSAKSDYHMVVGMVSVTLPVWREKYAAGVREATARHEAALRTRAERENLLAADVKMALYQVRDARRKMVLYRDTLLPKATESLRSMEAAFRTGAANFVDLVDARRLLLEFQLAYERALADHAQRLAELEMLVGRPMPRTTAGERSK